MNDWVNAEQHVERAHEHYDAGRWDDAEAELRQALDVNPEQPEWWFNLGLTLEAAGRYGDACEAFGRSFELRAGTGEPDVHAAILCGSNAWRKGDFERALAWFDRAGEIEPDNAELAINRIELLSELERHEDAESVFYLAQMTTPDNADLYAAISRSLLDRGLHDKAVWCLREAAKLDPEMPGLQARLAEAYAATGRLERARQLYIRELRHNPGDIDALMDLGELLVEMNRMDEAAEKFGRVLELEPDSPDAHASLGSLAERRGRLADALVHQDVVLRLDPEYPGARRRLARLLIDRGREEDRVRAADLLRIELRAQRTSTQRVPIEDRTDLARLLLDAELYTESASAYRALLEARPGDHLAHHHLSVALFELGRIDDGCEQARQALVFEPRFIPAMHNLAVAQIRRRRWTRARYWVRQASRINPHDPAVRRLSMRLRFHTATVLTTAVGVLAYRAVMWSARRTLLRPRRSPAPGQA